MKNTSNIYGTGNKSTQVGKTPREKNPASTVRLLVLGASFFVLVVLAISLYGKNGRLAYLLGMLAIAVFLWLSALFALRISTNHTKKVKPSTQKVLDALISTLKTDPESRVRSAAAEGLSVVELEKHSYYHTHDRLYGTLLKHGIAD